MKKVLVMVALVMVSVIVYAFNDRAEAKQGKKEVTGNNGEVVVMNKEMFLKDVFDYEKSKEWKYKGDKPAIIDTLFSTSIKTHQLLSCKLLCLQLRGKAGDLLSWG